MPPFLENIRRKLARDTRLLRTQLWKYRGHVAFGLFSVVVVDGLEILPPYLLKEAVDTLTAAPGREAALARLSRLAWIYMAVAGAQAVCRYVWRMFLIRTSLWSGRDLRSRFADHLLGLGASFFDRRPIGELMSLATNDVDAVRMAMGSGLLVFADAIFYFMTIPVAMWLLSPTLCLIALAPLPILPWIILWNERQVHDRFESVQESFARLSAMAQESLTGVRVLKAFVREEAQTRRFAREGENYAALSIRLARIQTSFGPIMDFTVSLGMVLLLVVGGRMLIFPGAGPGAAPAAGAAITLGTFVAFQRYIQKMVWPMAALGVAVNFYQRSVSSGHRLEAVHAHASDVPPPAVARLPAGWAGRARGEIELRGLEFTFPGAQEPVLRGVDLRIQPGERVAFIGTVGSGKSVLLSLLPRIYPVGRGMIFVDGVDVNDWDLGLLRDQVGFVGQEVFLFSETVESNLRLSSEAAADPGAARAEIETYARVAAVHEEIQNLAQAYDTRLGERGVNLSGGQKQRLTIARALAKRPPILVLDDALSAVDVATEEKILTALRARPGRHTELIAAHRVSTIRDANRIVVLDRGRVAQLGAHDELIRDRGGIYHSFYERQRVREGLREDLERYVEGLT